MTEHRTSNEPLNHLVTQLTHWGRATHICVRKITIIGSDNGLSPGRRQVIIWTNARILLIGPLRTNFREILIGIQTFSFRKMHLKISSAKWRPFCLGLNVLIDAHARGYIAYPVAEKYKEPTQLIVNGGSVPEQPQHFLMQYEGRVSSANCENSESILQSHCPGTTWALDTGAPINSLPDISL